MSLLQVTTFKHLGLYEHVYSSQVTEEKYTTKKTKKEKAENLKCLI
jgi:hypothetical protein